MSSVLACNQNSQAEDPLAELLQSKTLKKTLGKPSKNRSKMKYPLQPWFRPDSALENLFSNAEFAPKLIEWLKPTDPVYQTGKPRISFERTHVHADALILDRKRQSMFQLTVLVPHPAFATMIEGNIVEDFAQREPPSLKTTSSQDLESHGVKGIKYHLRSERCSGLFKIAQGTWIELRSVEPCGQDNALAALAEQLDLPLFEQKLQS